MIIEFGPDRGQTEPGHYHDTNATEGHRMATLVGVLGSVTPPGRLRTALEWTLQAAAEFEPDIDDQLLDLAGYRISFADGRPPEQLNDDTGTVVDLISGAEAVIFASPVYRASITGALKNLLDHVPVEALMDKPCGIITMGATQHHYLGADRHLRDVLGWYGALVTPTSVYLASADFSEGAPTERAREELRELVRTVLRLRAVVSGTAEPLGPRPLAGRR
jgi:FMN reductase